MEVTVWWADVRVARPGAEDLLDPVERARRAAYRRDVDRDRFTTGVVLTRRALGPLLGLAPGDVPLDRTCPTCGRPHGRPRPAGGGPPHVSVSHAGDLVAVAVTADQADGVGVDLEPVTADVDGLADRILAPGERPDGLLRTWVRKEAVLKATGAGLAVPMTSFPADDPGPGVHQHELTWPGPAYVACLAAIGAGPLVVRERPA